MLLKRLLLGLQEEQSPKCEPQQFAQVTLQGRHLLLNRYVPSLHLEQVEEEEYTLQLEMFEETNEQSPLLL